MILFPFTSRWAGSGGSSVGGNGLELYLTSIAVLWVFLAILMEAGMSVPVGGSEVDERVEYCSLSDALVYLF